MFSESNVVQTRVNGCQHKIDNTDSGNEMGIFPHKSTPGSGKSVSVHHHAAKSILLYADLELPQEVQESVKEQTEAIFDE